MRRAALIAGVLALLGAVGLYLFRPAAGPVADATVGGEPGATPPPPSRQAAATPGLEARASRAPASANRARDGDEPTDEDEEPIGAGTADDPVVCRLTFVGNGPRPSKVDLTLRPRDGSEGWVRRRATADAWEVRIPRVPAYSVSLTLDEWESNQPFRAKKPSADDRLELEVRLPNRPSIVVVDKGTGAALPEGSAREPRGLGEVTSRESSVPGPLSLQGPRFRADSAGTILLEKTARASDWWVGAPDHAWIRVRVSPDDVARRVALAPGGALRVQVEGEPAGERATVAASPAEAESPARQSLLTRDADTGRHSVEGLAPGRWVVSVGPKSELWVREPWTTADVEVVAGRTTDVRLVVPPRDPKVSRTVEFELVVPAGWQERPESIHIAGCADRTSGIVRSIDVPEDATLPWRVGVDSLKDGPYQVRVYPYNWSTLVRVRRGTTVIRVEVPTPARVRVRVLDEKDGAPLSGARVSLDALPYGADPFPEDLPDPVADEDAMPTWWWGGVDVLGEGREAGSYEGQVFAGAVTMLAHVDGYVLRKERVSIPASPMVFEHVMRLSRGSRIDVRIVRSGKTFDAAEGEVKVGPKREDGDDDEGSWSGDAREGLASFDGLPPGAYVVSWRGSSVEVVVTKEVTLRAGETVKVELEAPAPPPK